MADNADASVQQQAVEEGNVIMSVLGSGGGSESSKKGKTAASRPLDTFVVLGLMPFVQLLIGLYQYSCLPLYLVDRGWDCL